MRACESKLKELIKCGGSNDESSKYDEQSKGITFFSRLAVVRGNIQIQLAQRLKDITFKLRKREKKHFLKIQELNDDDRVGSF